MQALLANLTTNLKDLSLFRNQLSNTLIYDTERLHNLTALDLRETGIDGEQRRVQPAAGVKSLQHVNWHAAMLCLAYG